MDEFEVKFLAIDPEDLQKKLVSIGAKKEGDYFYRRCVFDHADYRLDKQGAWVRLRDEGDRVMLGFKQRLGMRDGENDAGMEEIETSVGDFDATRQILLKAGFVEKHYAENKRIRWKKDDVEFDIDFWPNIPPYLEIEAPSWEHVDVAIAALELNPEEKKIFSTYQVYEGYGIDFNEYTHVTFDKMIKHTDGRIHQQ